MTAFLSLFITIANQFDLPILEFLSMANIKRYLAIHLVLGLIGIIYSVPVISKGMSKLFTLKADSDSLTAVNAISCINAAARTASAI